VGQADAQRWRAARSGCSIIHTRNGGQTWVRRGSADGGRSWVNQEPNRQGHHLLRISALDADNAWIVGPLATGGGDPGVVLYTSDGGDNRATQTVPFRAFWSNLAMVAGERRLHLPVIELHAP
jgi:photosystem II stability/assembly factor-like uncharacterized protein